jgi:hypothetical protein
VSPEAKAYGTRKPGLEDDHAAADHDGGAPWWIGAGTHADVALAWELPDVPHAHTPSSVIASDADLQSLLFTPALHRPRRIGSRAAREPI